MEDISPLNIALEIEESFLFKQNIRIVNIDRNDYINSIEIAKKYNIGINDAVTYYIMKKYKIKEIYSFDTDFDRLPDIRRICSRFNHI